VLTNLAQAKYPDGSIPTVIDVVTIAAFLFGAGQDTTVRLLAASLRFLAEDPELQQRLRKERNRIPDFIEEVMRLEGPVKSDYRLVRRPVKIGDVDAKPGMTVMLLLGAINRDPRRFERPHELVLDRKNAREHLGFGRGIHACVGAPLARAETRISLERLFDRTSDIRIDEQKHGAAGARRFEYRRVRRSGAERKPWRARDGEDQIRRSQWCRPHHRSEARPVGDGERGQERRAGHRRGVRGLLRVRHVPRLRGRRVAGGVGPSDRDGAIHDRVLR
jgi:cytochrome P450